MDGAPEHKSQHPVRSAAGFVYTAGSGLANQNWVLIAPATFDILDSTAAESPLYKFHFSSVVGNSDQITADDSPATAAAAAPARLPYFDELIPRKVAGAEKERLTEADLDFHRGEYSQVSREDAFA